MEKVRNNVTYDNKPSLKSFRTYFHIFGLKIVTGDSYKTPPNFCEIAVHL